MPEKNYILLSDEDCLGNRTKQNTTKDGMGGPMRIRAESMKQYKKYKNK